MWDEVLFNASELQFKLVQLVAFPSATLAQHLPIWFITGDLTPDTYKINTTMAKFK